MKEALLVVVFILLVITVVSGLKKQDKGAIGENKIKALLKRLPKRHYKVINNVTLPVGNGTTQIDHIVFSKYGIFVIETKNMKGLIVGDKNDELWNQQIFDKTYSFQNPLRQNYKHVKTLQELLQITDQHIYSIVVFVGDSQFNNVVPDNVLEKTQLIDYIKSKNTEIYDLSEYKQFYHQVNAARKFRNSITDAKHKKYVKNIRENKQLDTTHRVPHIICDQCGSEMVIREAKQGKFAGQQFWGCTNYPTCRNTQHIDAVNQHDAVLNETVI